MAAAPQTAQSAPKPSAPRASSSASSMNLRRYAPYALVFVGVVGYVVWNRRRGSTPAAAGQTVVPTMAADAQTSPSAEDIAYALADLQGQPSTTPAPVTDEKTPWKAPTGEKLVGSGYTSPPNSLLVTDSSGDIYQGIVSNISAGELKKAGETLYYQVLPGIFEPAKGTLRPGTSLFYKQKRPVSQ